ncbi:unnamed protein product [Pleuronectes platessa]|uniref:Uncharacterized protein n=1 Tax=Pleuronectes platessa TaxID=8262 RepID=A0A9N7UF21_PLEPL|nr:unnamed protein product [Pleuronectes platessa]
MVRASCFVASWQWAHTETLPDSHSHVNAGTQTHMHTHLDPLLSGLPAGSSWGHSLTFPKDTSLHPFTAPPPQPPRHRSGGHAPASQSKLPTTADWPGENAACC